MVLQTKQQLTVNKFITSTNFQKDLFAANPEEEKT